MHEESNVERNHSGFSEVFDVIKDSLLMAIRGDTHNRIVFRDPLRIVIMLYYSTYFTILTLAHERAHHVCLPFEVTSLHANQHENDRNYY